MEFSWEIRQSPLKPSCVFVPVSGYTDLKKHLKEFSGEVLDGLSGVVCQKGIVLVGEENALPWVNGCQYLGKDLDAPHLFLSTIYQPSIPSSLLDKALFEKYNENLVLLPCSRFIVPLGNLRKISIPRIQQL